MTRKPRQPSKIKASMPKPSMVPMKTVKKTLDKAEMTQFFITQQQKQQQHKHDCMKQGNCPPGPGNQDSKQTTTTTIPTDTTKQDPTNNNSTMKPYKSKTNDTTTNSNDTGNSNDKNDLKSETMIPNEVIPTKGKKRKRSKTEQRHLGDIQNGSELDEKGEYHGRSNQRSFDR